MRFDNPPAEAITCTNCGKPRPPHHIAKAGAHPGWCRTCRFYETPSGRKGRAKQPDPYTVAALNAYLAGRRKRLGK